MKKQLPPPAPPCIGRETNAESRFNVSMQHILPLCKGELEGVVKGFALCDWNLKFKISSLYGKRQ